MLSRELSGKRSLLTLGVRTSIIAPGIYCYCLLHHRRKRFFHHTRSTMGKLNLPDPTEDGYYTYTSLLHNRRSPRLRFLYIINICLGVILLWLIYLSSDSSKSSSSYFASSSSLSSGFSRNNMIEFDGFNDELIPPNSVVDMNIGTNYSPFGPQDNRHRILVDPLFGVCDSNAKLTDGVTAFCFAVSNYTGFATFNEYNEHGGQSSSLAEVSPGTSHERFPILSKRTVLVLEGAVLFQSILQKNTKIFRLKVDIQGFELTLFRNIQSLLRNSDSVMHIKAECFCPKPTNGKQFYQVDNDCTKMEEVLHEAGYMTHWHCQGGGQSDVIAYKKGAATDFLPDDAFD